MEPPLFPASGLHTVRAAPGSDATLLLPVPTGTPPFNYQWSRAGASLDERFTASDDAGGIRLTVSAARTGDTNVYTLQASNAAGSDTNRVRLEVSADEAPTGEDPPTFLRRLQDLTVKVGTRTRFLVEIVSSTECKVTWFRNERRLLEAERVALARDGNFWCADVAAVSVDDAGRWTCTAENAGGRASCSAHLNVLVPKAYKRPEFVEELRALLTEQGTVSLECKVVGVPTPVLRWFKDSREIKAGDVFALTANAEDPTSLGTYTCEAVNCMGRAYSSSKVHVVGRGSREGSARPSSSSVTPEPPPIFTKELEDQFVRICEPLTLGCHIVVPPWPRSVVWYNKEGKIEASERYHVLEDGAGGYLLEVGSAEWPDEGEWKCVATSSGGRVGISTCYVTMDVPKNYRKPRFMENLQAVLTEEGLVSFECKVVGFPTPVLSWFKDGQELKPGDVYQLTGTNSLGSYCCIAKNCMGQASSSAELTVEDIQNQLNEEEKLQLFSKNQAPKFIQGLKSVEAKIDEPFRFTVKVAIPPEPSVLWYRDDQPVDESSRCHHGLEDRGVFYLDIQSLEFLDQAEWKCVAMNDFGHSVTSCFLKLIIPRHYKKPRFLENLQAILSDEGAVNLECKVIGVPQPVLKWYKDGEELKPGDIHRIISGQDGTCCLGTYTCEAQNCMGIAASSASLLGFDDSMKAKKKKAEEQALQRNLSLSTIHEERTSQMYDTPVGDVTTLDDKGEISFSFDGKEVSVSLYETPDLTEEEALQIVEMYADQLSENITEHNVVELPPLRFVKETSTSGNLLMEAVIIDVSPEYFVSPDEDMRTEADIDDISIADENGPPQLSLDQDVEIGGEDYLEKTMALLSEEKSDVSLKLDRKKSDSQRSEDFFSLSRDQSLSEDKRDDDTQAISDLQSFASAHSSGKPKSKSSKPFCEDGQESSEPTKTILFKDNAIKYSLDAEPIPIVKPKRERRTSRSSRRSSSGSEKSVSKSREESLRKKESFEIEMPIKPKISDEEFKEKTINISSTLSKVINDIQIIERDIILKSELMSSAATASRSLEIISSLISPLSEIHSIVDAVKESATESKEVSSTLFNGLPQPLKALQQSLTFIEKCIDMESDSKTLVKKTCVAFIETCGSEMQKLISDINFITSKEYLLTEDRVLTEIESINNEMSTVIKFSSDTIKTRNLISEASEIKVDEPSLEVKHLRDTQKAVFELKSPLNSLLSIVESADSEKIIDLAKVRNSEVILNDMSGSIQDLQTALEQIETLSVKESSTSLHKYNTEIIETVMESVVKLRNSFEQLSTKTEGEDKVVIKQAVASIKENLNKISSQIGIFERNVGSFDVLQSENKLDALQKMAQILIALENNLPRLESMLEVKNHMTVFHKNLTKVLENVIESNESKKYFTLMEICDAVNRINASLKNLDVHNVLPLASLNNTLRIVQDHFISNVFDSELNCSVLTNIADTLVCIQEAIHTAEEVSMHIHSEHTRDIAPHVYDATKAKVVVEHIDHAIAAIENVKAIESTQDLKLSVAPTLENICPVLEDLKRSVASMKASGVEEDHISEISEVSSFAQTFASPLCELNQNLVVLNQQLVENIESLKENSEVMATIAKTIHELHTTLEILQQDVISQYSEDLAPYDVSINIASAVQNLQSCVIMIQEQTGIEAADEMSTLEDISGIKTTADTIPSDRLVLPAAEETAVEQAIIPFNQELQTTTTAQALQTLNEHITVLQTPDIIDALDTLSEVSDYSSLKSFVIGLGDLHSGIEEVLHPLLMEGSNEIANLINPSKLTAIAEPMQELQQSLSVLDTSNIPIYENLLEMPTERIHSVIQSVSGFKEHLDKCMLAVFPALHTADNTLEIANKVGALREVCEHLKDIIETGKAVANIPVPEEVKALELTVDSLLDATNVSKGIKIEQVKTITEELYEKVATVQEEMIQFIPQNPEKLAQEAKLIQTIDEVQSNIAVLEQYDFVDLSKASDLTWTSLQVAVEVESDSLILMEDIVDSAVNVVQDSSQEMPMADLMIVEDFFKTCKNEFTILRYLISKATTHKKIIRLLQEFSSLQSTINDFKDKKFELNLSEDVNGCLATFLIHADDCLQTVQTSLVKIVNSQTELLIEKPLAKFENSTKALKAVKETKHNELITETVSKFVEILETAKPSLQHVQADILDEIRSGKSHILEGSILANMIEEFSTFVEVVKTQSTDVATKDILQKVSTCIEKHQDFKDASGTGKTLILLKCLCDCSDVLQESLFNVKIPKQKVEEGPLKAVLKEMLEPLQALHSQLTNVQEQVLRGVDEDSISVDITTTESLVQTMTEKHKEIIERMETEEAIANDEISLIMEVDKEIHSIQDSLRSIEGVQVAQVVKEIAKPVEAIEKSMHCILSSDKVSAQSEGKLPKEKSEQIIKHIDQYIELIEIVEEISAIIKIEDVIETVEIAKELRESIAASEIMSEGEVSDERYTEVREEQTRLAQKLETALSALQVQVLDSAQELAPTFSTEVLQRIAKVTAQLQAELVAVTGIRVAVQAPAQSIDMAKMVEAVEDQTVKVSTPETSTAAFGSKATILEQVGLAKQLPGSEQLFATTEMLEKTIAETKEVVTSETAKSLSTETIMDSALAQTEEAIAIEGTEAIVMEQTETVALIAVSTKDVKVSEVVSDQAQEIATQKTLKTESVSAVEIEDLGPEVHEAAINENQDDDGICQKAELKEAPKATIDILVLHIDNFMSDDITEFLEELSNIINVEELKQSISIARELRENIAASEVELKAETSDVLTVEVTTQQANLAQQLKTALVALETLPLDTLAGIPSINKDTLQRVTEITEKLCADLAAVTDKQHVMNQNEEAKPKPVVSDIAQLKSLDLKVTISAGQADLTKKEVSSVESTLSEVKESIAAETEVVDKETKDELGETKLARLEEIAISAKVGETLDTEPIPLEKASVSDVSIVTTEQALQIYEEPLQKAKTETLLQNISEFLSDNIVEIIDQIAVILNVDELKQSVVVARDLRKNIIETASVMEIGLVKYEVINQQAQQLQNALTTIQVLTSDTTNEHTHVIGTEALQQLANITTHLSEELAAVIPQVHAIQEPLKEKIKVKESASESAKKIVEATEIINGNDQVTKKAESMPENEEHISSKTATVIMENISMNNILANTEEAKPSKIDGSVIGSDETDTKNQAKIAFDEGPKQVAEDASQTITETGDKKSLDNHIFKEIVVEEKLVTAIADNTVVKSDSSTTPQEKNEYPILTDTVASIIEIPKEGAQTQEKSSTTTESVLPDQTVAIETATLVSVEDLVIKTEETIISSLVESKEEFGEITESCNESNMITEAVAIDQLIDGIRMDTIDSVTKEQVGTVPKVDKEQARDQEKICTDLATLEQMLVTDSPKSLEKIKDEIKVVHQRATESVIDDSVTKEHAILVQDNIPATEGKAVVEVITVDINTASTMINTMEDVKPSEQDVSIAVAAPVEELANEAVNNTIIMVEEAIQPLEQEYIITGAAKPKQDSEVKLTEQSELAIIAAVSTPKVLEIASAISEEQVENIQKLDTGKEHANIIITEENMLKVAKQIEVPIDQLVVEAETFEVTAENIAVFENEKPKLKETPVAETIETESIKPVKETESLEHHQKDTAEHPVLDGSKNATYTEETKNQEEIASEQAIVGKATVNTVEKPAIAVEKVELLEPDNVVVSYTQLASENTEVTAAVIVVEVPNELVNIPSGSSVTEPILTETVEIISQIKDEVIKLIEEKHPTTAVSATENNQTADVTVEDETKPEEPVSEVVEVSHVKNSEIISVNTEETKVQEPEPVFKPIKLTDEIKKAEDSTVPSDALLLPETSQTVTKSTPEASPSQPADTTKIAFEQESFIEHLDELIANEISELVDKNSVLTNSQELNESMKLAKHLKESIQFIAVTEELSILEDAKAEQAKLVQKFQDALSILHTKASENAAEIASTAKLDTLQRVSEIITHLQEDLENASTSSLPDVLKAAEIVSIHEEDSMKKLEVLLQEVTDKINLTTVRDAEDTEALRDSLDEVQTVIIKLKRDYDGAADDTLNETLEDLECSVRSVQLQITEDSPPELLKDACATLQLLVNNMNETQEVRVAESMFVEAKNENILEKCSTDTDETVKLLELASKANIKDSNLIGIVSSLSLLKETIKTLKLSFVGNADILIDKGVDVLQSLDQLEDKVFMLEKDLAEVSLNTETRDHIITAIHSVYGSISNMRGTISSIQKRFMFENYGKPSETLLRSIKNVCVVLDIDDANKHNWKAFSKSLRQVLNHFEDIKFYINLDKTARLPSDAAFTKIILEELKSNICEVIVPQASILGTEATKKVENLLQCVNKNLTHIESKSTLEVKEKIPIFKELSSQILETTDFMKTKMHEMSKEFKSETMDQELKILEGHLIPAVEETAVQESVPINIAVGLIGIVNEKISEVKKLDDVSKIEEVKVQIIEQKKMEEASLEVPSTSQGMVEETVKQKDKVRKQVLIQEIDIDNEIQQVASVLVDEVSAKAFSIVQSLVESDVLETNLILLEAVSPTIETEVLQEAEISQSVEDGVVESVSIPQDETEALEKNILEAKEDLDLPESVDLEDKSKKNEDVVEKTEVLTLAENSQAIVEKVTVKQEPEYADAQFEISEKEKDYKSEDSLIIVDEQVASVSSNVETATISFQPEKKLEKKAKQTEEGKVDDNLIETKQELHIQKGKEEEQFNIVQEHAEKEHVLKELTSEIVQSVTEQKTDKPLTEAVSELSEDTLEQERKEKVADKKEKKKSKTVKEEQQVQELTESLTSTKNDENEVPALETTKTEIVAEEEQSRQIKEETFFNQNETLHQKEDTERLDKEWNEKEKMEREKEEAYKSNTNRQELIENGKQPSERTQEDVEKLKNEGEKLTASNKEEKSNLEETKLLPKGKQEELVSTDKNTNSVKDEEENKETEIVAHFEEKSEIVAKLTKTEKEKVEKHIGKEEEVVETTILQGEDVDKETKLQEVLVQKEMEVTLEKEQLKLNVPAKNKDAIKEEKDRLENISDEAKESSTEDGAKQPKNKAKADKEKNKAEQDEADSIKQEAEIKQKEQELKEKEDESNRKGAENAEEAKKEVFFMKTEELERKLTEDTQKEEGEVEKNDEVKTLKNERVEVKRRQQEKEKEAEMEKLEVKKKKEAEDKEKLEIDENLEEEKAGVEKKQLKEEQDQNEANKKNPEKMMKDELDDKEKQHIERKIKNETNELEKEITKLESEKKTKEESEKFEKERAVTEKKEVKKLDKDISEAEEKAKEEVKKLDKERIAAEEERAKKEQKEAEKKTIKKNVPEDKENLDDKIKQQKEDTEKLEKEKAEKKVKEEVEKLAKEKSEAEKKAIEEYEKLKKESAEPERKRVKEKEEETAKEEPDEAEKKKGEEKKKKEAEDKAKTERKQKEETETFEKERGDAEKKLKEEAEILEKERDEAEKTEKEKAEQKKLEKNKAAEKANLESERKQKEEADKLEKDRVETEKKEKEEAEKKTLDQKKKDAEEINKLELERKQNEEAEKHEKESVEAEKKRLEEEERNKVVKEEAENKRLMKKQKKDAEDEAKLESDRKEKEEAEKIEKVKAEAEKKRVEEERVEKEKEEARRIERERDEAEKNRLEEERLKKEKEEAKIIEKERVEADKKRFEEERVKKEKEECERKLKEEAGRIEKERAEAEKKRLQDEERDKKAKVEGEKKKLEKKEKKEAEDKAKLEAERKNIEETEKLEKEKAEAERTQLEEERVKKVKEEAQKIEKERVEAEKKQCEEERVKKEKEESKRKQEEEAEIIEKERAEAEKKRLQDEERDKKANVEGEKKKLEKEGAEDKAKLEGERKHREETEKLKKEKAEAERTQLEEERVKKENEEAQKIEEERVEAEKKRCEEERVKTEKEESKRKQEKEAERIEKERAEAEKKRLQDEERDKKAKVEGEKKKLEKKEKKEAEDKAKSESERKHREETEKLEKKKAEVERTQLEEERVKKEKADLERKQKEEAERTEKQKAEAEKKRLEDEELDKKEKEEDEKKKLKKNNTKEAEEKAEAKAEKMRVEEEEQAKKEKEAENKILEIKKIEEEGCLKKEVEERENAEKARAEEESIKNEKKEFDKGTKGAKKRREVEERTRIEKENLEQEAKEKEKEDKRKKEAMEAENKRKEEETLKQLEDTKTQKEKQEKEELEAKKKRQHEEKLKEEVAKIKKEKDADKLEKDRKAAEKKLKQEEKLKQEQEEKAQKQKLETERKRKAEKRVKEEQEAQQKAEKLKQEEVEKQEREKKIAESLEKEKQEEIQRVEEEKAKLEKKKLTKKKKEEEEARMQQNDEEIEKVRKQAIKKRKDQEKSRLVKEQELDEEREREIRETERKIREERRREIEKDLTESKTKSTITAEAETLPETIIKRGENGDISAHRSEDHYIKEYHYDPTRQKTDERTKFVNHNHRDYTMEFLRPSGYREKSFEHEKYSERESLGKGATIYKAQTIILDSQLRSSAPPQADRSQSERRIDRFARSDSEKRVERHKSKALSEARSLVSEKRPGVSRDLKRKPVFSTYLTDRTAVEGSRVKLTCSVLSSSDPKITWYKNGIVLDNKLKYRTKFMDGLITLEVLNAVVSDSAEYSCTVENENGSVNTSANLKVYPSFEASPIPPTFTRSIRDTYHLAENELVLECRIRGQPLPTITWLKDDKPVSSNERYQAFYLADGVCRLAISSPTPEDSGKYTCQAENSVWSDQITHVVSFTGKKSCLSPNIITKERSRFNRQALESRRPHFTNVLSDYKVAKGGTIGLQVEIRGSPTRVEWLREGHSVTEVYRNARTFVEQGLYTLALNDVTEKESGMYTCRAWHTHGNVDMNAAITVIQPNELEGKPAIIVGRPEKDILISVGEDVNISFRVQGEPKPKLVFMKGIRDITTNQRVCKMTSDDYVKFTLKRSVVSDAGTYCILARNAYGCDRAFVTVVVRQRASSENLISDWTYPMDDSALSINERKYKSVPDRIPGEPSVVDGGNNWVSLAWPKPDPGLTAPVLAYKVESWLLGKEGGARWVELGITPLNSFDAFNLKQGEEYHFRVTPRNRYGWGESVQSSSPIGIGLAGDRPEFVEILPGQLKVLAGETANLSCSVKGKPLPEIVWMKNGHEIEEESRMTTLYNGQDCSLTIRDICIEDEARYSCEATNVHGRASTYARLAVVMDRLIWEADAKLKRERSQDAVGDYPPQFTMRLRDRRVQATYPVRLTCQVVGNPAPTLSWFKDGELLVFDSRRNNCQDEHFHTLEIAPTTLEDGGVYEAMARNSSGAVSCRCSLVVDKGIRAYVAPEFCCGLEPLYRLSEGEELRISAVVEAYPSVGVTWYRDGVRLRPSRRAIMTLDRDGQIELALASVTPRDAGVYTCTASNEVGRASTSGKVDVVEDGGQPREMRTPPVFINAPDVPYSKEPMFVRKPRSSEAREGDTVIIACEVIGDPKPDVYWLRDFLKPDYYRDATHFKRVGDGPEYRFEIPHAKLDYTGAYSVVARNVHGEAKAIISLQILAKDLSSTDDSHNVRYGRVEVIPRFERELTDLLTYDGDAVEFECQVSGNPEPDIRWFHYNEIIRDCPDFESSFEDGAARLKIKQVTAEDEGTYSCEASNNLGKATSSACLVVYPPGEPNTLSQRLRRPPALLSAASTPRSTPRSTPARSVSRTPGPESRRLCSPSRQTAPSFYTYPFNKVVEEGETVTFKCAVKGQPSPWATWDKDGIIITPSARITTREKDELLRILEIEQVSIEDVGVYRIMVENEFGRAEASARLEVITQTGKFYSGVRAHSASPRKSLTYRRYPSVPRQD